MTDEQRKRVVTRQQSRVTFVENKKATDVIVESSKPWYLLTAEEVISHEEKIIKGLKILLYCFGITKLLFDIDNSPTSAT